MAGKAIGRPVSSSIGSIVIHLNKIDSTNDYAKSMALTDANEGIVVISDIQTNGKGRFDRKWYSPRGGLWLSVILRPVLSLKEIQKITLLAGIAVAKTLREEYMVPSNLKWPNDVIVDGKKICGILTESVIEKHTVKFIIVGIGLNVTNRIPYELKDSAISLYEKSKKKVKINDIFHNLIANLNIVYGNFLKHPDTIVNEWRDYADTIGKDVKIIMDDDIIRGKAVGITKEGLLKIKLKNGKIQNIIAGDCIYLR